MQVQRGDSNCQIVQNNASSTGGGLEFDHAAGLVSGCTFFGNNANLGDGIRIQSSAPEIINTLFAFNDGYAINCYGESAPGVVACCDIFGNVVGNWVGCLSGLDGQSGNFSADPLFCNEASGDYSLHSNSPCAPGNHPDGAACGLIGALDVGCGLTTAVEQTSWGNVKTLFG